MGTWGKALSPTRCGGSPLAEGAKKKYGSALPFVQHAPVALVQHRPAVGL